MKKNCLIVFEYVKKGSSIIAIVVFAHRIKLNPDNLATPLAASLGDLVTLAILSSIGTVFYSTRNSSVQRSCVNIAPHNQMANTCNIVRFL